MTPTSIATSEPRMTRLEDYRPPNWLVPHVELLFELGEDETRVTSTASYRRNPEVGKEDNTLVLDGTDLDLQEIRLNGVELESSEYERDESSLTLTPDVDEFALQVVTLLRPQDNTSLEGLYRSGSMFCTQMEAQGFRRVTYFQDRPDVLAQYTTTIVAEATRYPTLLSNGNLIDSGNGADSRHFATWHDPFPKPCYLFALVAGDLACRESAFTTQSGRNVELKLFVDKGNEDKTEHAMESLRRSMRWDEEAFGLEYDLDIFMVVAVADFNMGAMENKGLNLFNDQLVLARPDTATDQDYHRIEGVIGHEYFHNWSGNRVTCRDWFQLSLKEGLTVFRDQEFSGAMGHAAVQRIADVRDLRARQFPEDAGPFAHPIRPRAFLTIDNFYTSTIYEKGAEVIRMLRCILGNENFAKGCELYFKRHDGQAVTTEHFVRCMEEAGEIDLSQFRHWYEQAGTPVIRATGTWKDGAYELHLEQSCAPSPGQPSKQPYHIPVRIGLLGADGSDLPLKLSGDAESEPSPTTRVLSMQQQSQTFRFEKIDEEPVPSLLRGFSAPVRLEMETSQQSLAFQAANDSDLFNRWEAVQRLTTEVVFELVEQHQAGQPLSVSTTLTELLGRLLADETLEAAFLAEALNFPDESALGDLSDSVDTEAIHRARKHLDLSIARTYRDRLLEIYHAHTETASGDWCVNSAGSRALRNVCLGFLSQLDEPELLDLCVRHGSEATNMTDEFASLEILAHREDSRRDEAVARFKERWQHEPLVMNKWFAAQAKSSRSQTVDDVLALAKDSAFDSSNPNKLRALYRTFARNPLRFHSQDGRGYTLLADVVLDVDKRNPVLAGRLVGLFNEWRRYDKKRQLLQEAELRRILATTPLSDNVMEVASKAVG
ncbi:MAG: aminopeptidase N [Planctomycetota bacterium]|nr:aminopeptidase N [Planctomycetota bacterium]